jgi:hypothetical protein
MLGGLRDGFTNLVREYKLSPHKVNLDVAGVLEVTLKNLLGDAVFDLSLNGSAKRSCSEAWLPADLHQALFRSVC